MRKILLLTLFILPVLAGCYTIPSYDPQYYGGMAEVSLKNEEALDEWNGAFTGKKAEKEKSSRRIFPFLSGSAKKKESHEFRRPAEFYPDNKFFPPEEIGSITPPVNNKITQISSTVPPALKIIPQTESALLDVDPAQIQSLSLVNNIDSGPVNNIDSGPIRQVHYTAETGSSLLNTSALNWKKQTAEAIDHLEKEIQKKQKEGTIAREDQARLRLLYLAADEHEKAIAKDPKNADAISRFWESECQGLSKLLQGTGDAKASGSLQIEEAANHFQTGLDSLRTEAPIRIRKILFTEAPSPFGLYREKEKPITAGETVYVYAELDNVISKAVKNGEDLAIACTWEIRDSKGNSVLPLHEQECKTHSESRLRDIVLNISANLPKDLLPGEYTFQLTVSDRNNPKGFQETQSLSFRTEKDR